MNTQRRKISERKRREVFTETGGACFYCGGYATDIDHIAPHSYAANNSQSNLIASCRICNQIAGNKHFESVFSKRDYILKQRNTLKWKRRIAAMEKTIIYADAPATPEHKPKPTRATKKEKKPKNKKVYGQEIEPPVFFVPPRSVAPAAQKSIAKKKPVLVQPKQKSYKSVEIDLLDPDHSEVREIREYLEGYIFIGPESMALINDILLDEEDKKRASLKKWYEEAYLELGRDADRETIRKYVRDKMEYTEEETVTYEWVEDDK